MDDAPDTPAPLFALQAFKHAIFGTPKADSVERRPRRRDLRAANGGPSHNHLRKSVSTPTLASPAKGILLTPRTAGGTRKTVSFGGAPHMRAVDRTDEGMTEGLPRDLPGRFPSPWATKTGAAARRKDAELLNQRQAPTRSLGGDHDALSLRFQRLSTKAVDAAITTTMPADVKDLSGLNDSYWRQQYESYASKSALEMRKLVKREQIARKFAKHKDDEVFQIQEELAAERRKVAALEAKVERLNTGKTNSDQGKTLLRRLDSLQTENSKLRAELDDLRRAAHKSDGLVKTTLDTARTTDRSRVDSVYQPKATFRKTVDGGVSSDIWADAVNKNEEEKKPRRRPIGSLRQPLTTATGNEARSSRDFGAERIAGNEMGGEAEVESRKPENDGKEFSPRSAAQSTMTAERREAAKKRLEEKKRARARELGKFK